MVPCCKFYNIIIIIIMHTFLSRRKVITLVAVTTQLVTIQGWKIWWYFWKYRKYPIFSIISIYISSIWTWQKLFNTEKMLRAQVISQQNTQTENQNVVTMCHIKKYLKDSIKIENIANIRYFRTKISDIYPIYINDIYRLGWLDIHCRYISLIYINDIYRQCISSQPCYYLLSYHLYVTILSQMK